jgi:Fur family ferric uptake transcriptional regulator
MLYHIQDLRITLIFRKEEFMTYNTPMRTQIVAFFENNRERAFSLEEICSCLAPDGKGKSTIYRLVSRLVDAGCVRRVADGKTRHVTYQFIGGEKCSEHLHLKCVDCGKLIHLDENISHAFGQALKDSRGFFLDEGALLFGKCSDCGGAR